MTGPLSAATGGVGLPTRIVFEALQCSALKNIARLYFKRAAAWHLNRYSLFLISKASPYASLSTAYVYGAQTVETTPELLVAVFRLVAVGSQKV